MRDGLQEISGWVIALLEAAGVAVIAAGALVALVMLAMSMIRGDVPARLPACRATLGKAILFGLEFLVAADIIITVTVEPSMSSVAALAGIVAIRTFLSFALEIEIEGRLPWRRKSPESVP